MIQNGKPVDFYSRNLTPCTNKSYYHRKRDLKFGIYPKIIMYFSISTPYNGIYGPQ